MDKNIKIYNINDPAQYDDEIEYWLKVSPEEKLSIAQDLREQYIKLFNKQELYDESRRALRRVYKIIKLSQS
ncbi:MAG: hypothetical protein HXY48_00820 [Ignavibacteriaceae bacterium]|jgi:hypothetical protein|nr:hypothetical protein [Ignavibacteriaceae bacterium]